MTEWETVGIFPDCAFAALGDTRLTDDDTWRRDSAAFPFPGLFTIDGGYGMVYGLSEEDGVPIEIGRIAGEIVGARIEFTNDVSALEARGKGSWQSLGRLRIGPEGAVALDKKQQDVEWEGQHPWRHALPLPTGWYVAETFLYEGDHLGIRILRSGQL